MTDYTLRIYRRRKPNETSGELLEIIDLEAANPDEAEREALKWVVKINWRTQFAGIMGADGKFLRLWTSKYG
jgi:hypothetical protein